MAIACYINIYHSYSDRGAFVQKEAFNSIEVDQEEIKVGEQLPRWKGSDAPIVTAYDGHQLCLDYRSAIPSLAKQFTIKEGEEQLVDEGILSQNYGVTCYSLTTVKVLHPEIIYIGDIQLPDPVRQELKGCKGHGMVAWPNNDGFEGTFHLNYAHINGPCYAAEGRFLFADGSSIERAWLKTSDDFQTFLLTGLFRIHHPDGPDSIALFKNHHRYGFELFLDEKQPYVREWCRNERIRRMAWNGYDYDSYDLKVMDFQIDDESQKDCMTLNLTLHNEYESNGIYQICQQGGSYLTNNYDQKIYEPSASIDGWENGELKKKTPKRV